VKGSQLSTACWLCKVVCLLPRTTNTTKHDSRWAQHFFVVSSVTLGKPLTMNDHEITISTDFRPTYGVLTTVPMRSHAYDALQRSSMALNSVDGKAPLRLVRRRKQSHWKENKQNLYFEPTQTLTKSNSQRGTPKTA
jgi:hypothetical protein